ncbi:restriction endonuclease FokI C-terminal domain-containing protein [Desulforamulus ruminis]|uniref:restriction endonuclease FokI C-terminal domain-containing protein n=1 Tax=Desulforamulus ruminis TaxID=1564 RepID=UPI00235383C1|nr:restriction endonuclease FokI C-terminal domain-containing protein [Desulforamulus ruminis]
MKNYGWVQNTSNLSTVRDTIDLVPEYGIDHLSLKHLIMESRVRNGSLPKRWDWDARCRIKAIHALGLVSLDRNIQGYVLTDIGKALQQCKKSSKYSRKYRMLTNEEITVLKDGLLTNPPVVRVLDLLNNERRTKNQGMSKYDIGAKLGFVGDSGFTHLDPEWIVANDFKFTNKEGDADKWARTILSWLCQVGWVYKLEERKQIFGQKLALYSVLPEVENVLRYSSKRVIKNVPSEMLCSNHHAFPKLVQKRRVVILDSLSKPVTLNTLVQDLAENGIDSNEEVVRFEIISLRQAGFRIASDGGYYRLEDRIRLDIEHKLFETPNEVATPIEKLIEQQVVQYESTIPARLVDNLIRYGYDGTKNSEFESAIYEFFRFLGYSSTLLGQGRGRVADVLVKYVDRMYARSYGVIIDTKATSSRYSFPAGDVRKMKEYIELHGVQMLSEKIPNHAFAFVSSEFTDNVEGPLEEIYVEKGVKGTAIRVLNLLELGNSTIKGDINISELYELYTTNGLFQVN